MKDKMTKQRRKRNERKLEQSDSNTTADHSASVYIPMTLKPKPKFETKVSQ